MEERKGSSELKQQEEEKKESELLKGSEDGR
jgi:hypothetical protein